MNRTITKLKRTAAGPLAALVTSAAALTVGCSNMATTATETSQAFGTSAEMTGKVHGGNQPVYNATVQLYTVGFNGPGSAGTLLATTTTNSSGGFTFSKQASGTYSNTTNQYVCPTGTGVPDFPLYIKTTGGNTTGTGVTSVNNSAAVFLAPVGSCSAVNASTFINISEVTTAATVVALEQYINPSTEMIGADGIAVAANSLLNSMKTVSTLVNANSGLANTTLAIPGSTSGLQTSNVTITATPESAKLNTVANILSSCINQVSATSGTNCSTLFANATPPTTAGIARSSQPSSSFPAATDTLQAALYMFLYPTDGSTAARTNLFNLSPASGAPYQPTITALPTDWTIAISYSGNQQCANSGSIFFSQASDINVDGNGNLWISNGSNSTAAGASQALVEMSANGVALSCTSNIANGFAGGTIDNEGDVWIGDHSANFIYRLTAPGSTQVTANNPAYSIRTYTTAAPVSAITVDGSDNIFFTTTNGTTGSVYIIKSGASISGVNAPVLISNTVGPNPQHIFPDNAGDLFVTSGAGYVTELSTTTATSATNGYVSTQIGGIPSPTVGVVVGTNNRVYITSADPGASLSVLAPNTSGMGYSLLFSTAANTGGLSNPQGVFIDGGQTSYAANLTANSSTGLYALSAVDTYGVEVSASGNSNGGYQKSLQYFNQMHAIAVDQSGNIWVTNVGNGTAVTEVVGAGVMIYQGYAAGLQNGRFQTIA